MSEALMQVSGLRKVYGASRSFGSIFTKGDEPVAAVDDVSFSIARGETLAIVGESGCGKSTTARMVTRLMPSTAGSVTFEGVDVLNARGEDLKRLRRRVQYVFQDPFASLNGRMRIGDILEEPMIIHRLGDRAWRRNRVEELLSWVGMAPEQARRFPHEFSGGQRQRVGIARALAVEPSLIVCDEPVSALDVSIQAQVINILVDLQKTLGLSYLFIAHDLAVVKHIADRICVMQKGKIVETAETETLFANPQHDYTKRLLSSIPGSSQSGRGAAQDAPKAELRLKAYREKLAQRDAARAGLD